MPPSMQSNFAASVAQRTVTKFWTDSGTSHSPKAIPDWGQKAKDLTDGRGVDHVIEVGGPATLMRSIAACRAGGISP